MSQEIKDATPIVADAAEEVKKVEPEAVAEKNGKAENGDAKEVNKSSNENEPSSTVGKEMEPPVYEVSDEGDESQKTNGSSKEKGDVPVYEVSDGSDESQKTNGSNSSNGVEYDTQTSIPPIDSEEEEEQEKGVKRKSDIEPVKPAVAKKLKVDDTEAEPETAAS